MRKALYPLALLVLVSFCLAASAPCDAVTKEWARKNLENKIKGHVHPAWTLFQEGTAKSVVWQANATNPRFATYDSGTDDTTVDDLVLDKETGLVWERRVNTGTRMWAGARNHCYPMTKGGRLAWRLPTLEELTSLLYYQPSSTYLPDGHPFENVANVDYWTATEIADDPSFSWYVNIGANPGGAEKNTNKRTWCVRGGVGLVGK